MSTKVEEKYYARPSLGILCNPLGGRARARLKEIRRLGNGICGSLYREASTPAAIETALSELMDRRPSVLCFIGGDGTVQAALTALHALVSSESWPTLVALPGGTTNMTAKDLGSWPSVEEGLTALAALIRPGDGGGASRAPENPGDRPTLPGCSLLARPVVRLEGAGVGVLLGMFFGAGAVAAGVRSWNHGLDRTKLPGDGAIGATVLKVLGALAFRRENAVGMVQPLACSINGESESRHRGLLVLVSTLNRLLLNTTPYWGEEPESLHMTVVEEGAKGLWWRLPRLAWGRPGGVLKPEDGYLSRNARSVHLTFDGPFVVDGELFEARAREGSLRLSALTGVEWLIP